MSLLRLSPSELAESHSRWQLAMRKGDFPSAWIETDLLEGERRLYGKEDYHLCWDGTPLEGRNVFVRCLHGLGDTLQFSRFLPILKRQAKSLTIAVQPDLLSLFQAQPYFGRIVDGYVDYQCPADSIEIEIMELAYYFRSKTHTLPGPNLFLPPCPYLPDKNESFKVAIFWRSSNWAGGRHVPLSAFDALASVPGVDFYTFQQSVDHEERSTSALRLLDLSSSTTDIFDLALALRRMNLVIAVDSMPAHLAASLGRPTWLLLDSVADWRWMEDAVLSPWYPAIRIFRRVGTWRDLADLLAKRLEDGQ